MTGDPPEGLDIAATLPREDPRDALVLPAASGRAISRRRSPRSASAPAIGTSSVRRIAQLIPCCPARPSVPIRGNVDTRLNKLDAGEFDALMLASAGMRAAGSRRADLRGPAFRYVRARTGPGNHRDRDPRPTTTTTRTAVQRLHDRGGGDARSAAERAVVAALGGGCQLPLGAIAIPDWRRARYAGRGDLARRRHGHPGAGASGRSTNRWRSAGAWRRSSPRPAPREVLEKVRRGQ